MNTPKLTSIISSTLGNTDAARNGRQANPGHGLDFSQLLGERRSQSAVAPPNARSNDSGAAVRRNDNRAENAPRPENARPASQGEARSTERTPTRSSDNASTRSHRSERAAAHESNSAGPEQTPASSGSSAQAAGNDAAQAADNARHTAGEQGGDTPGASGAVAANTPAEPAPTQTSETAGAPADALLAEHAAAAGLAAMIAGQVAAPAIEAGAGNAPTDTASLVGSAPLMAGEGVAGPAGAAAFQLEGTATAHTGTAGTVTSFEGEALAVGVAQAGRVANSAAASAAGPARGGANTGLAAALNPAAGEPASGTAAATTRLNTIAAAIGTATEGSPTTPVNPATLSPAQAVGIDTPQAEMPAPLTPAIADTAAARSLQEFTAMVAAARATSGTTLQAVAQAQPSAPFAGQVPGLAPAGIFGLQAPAAGLPGSPGIAAPLNSPQWPTEFGRQFISIAQAANGLGQVAELRLDPPDLGPLRITINLNDNVAHAVFSSPHASVRQTVENALPQLQQMLEQAGISLGQANVNDQQQSGNPFQNASGNAARHASAGGNSADGGDAPLTAEELRASRPANPNTLLDTFA